MKFTLQAQSLMLLRQILGLPGWAKSIEDIYKGGKLLAVTLPTPDNGTPIREPVTFELDGPDRDLCKVALQFAVQKEAVPPSEWIMDLCDALEFISKPKPPPSSP